jgi:hypothetical protein
MTEVGKFILKEEMKGVAVWKPQIWTYNLIKFSQKSHKIGLKKVVDVARIELAAFRMPSERSYVRLFQKKVEPLNYTPVLILPVIFLRRGY